MPRSGLTWDGNPRIKPPFGAAEIDWGHPLTRGLRFLVLANEHGGLPADMVCGYRSAPGVAALGWAPSAMGLALRGTADRNDVFASIPPAATSAGVSLVALAISTELSITQYREVLRKESTVPMFLVQNMAGAWAASFGSQASEYTDTTRAVVVGECVCLVGTYNGTTRLYVNGVLGETVTGITATDSTANVHLGSAVGNTQLFHGFISLGAIYERALMVQEALQFYHEPYAFLRPKVARRYFVPAAAGVTIRRLLIKVGV